MVIYIFKMSNICLRIIIFFLNVKKQHGGHVKIFMYSETSIHCSCMHLFPMLSVYFILSQKILDIKVYDYVKCVVPQSVSYSKFMVWTPTIFAE